MTAAERKALVGAERASDRIGVALVEAADAYARRGDTAGVTAALKKARNAALHVLGYLDDADTARVTAAARVTAMEATV